MNAKKISIFILLQSALGLTASLPVQADTLSDLRAQCSYACHNTIVSPSGWSMDGSTTGRYRAEMTLDRWSLAIAAMGDGKCGFTNVGPSGTLRSVASRFLYDKQYLPSTTISLPLTSISVSAVYSNSSSINIGQSQEYRSTGIFSNGESQFLRAGSPWYPQLSMPVGRTGTGVGVVDDIFYVVGGNGASGVVATVQAYDVAANTWSTKASLPTARTGLGVGIVNGILYAVGGSNTSGSLAVVEAYNPATNTWSTKASLPTARTQLSVAVVNGILYAVGGSNAGSSVATVEAYDPVTNTWTAKADMPTARNALGVGVMNGLIYAVGGSNNNLDLSTVEAYNPATNTWVTQISMPTARSGLSVGVLYGVLHAVGGVSNGTIVATVEAYDPVTYTWATQTPMPTARTGMGVSVEHDFLYFLGGQKADNSYATTVEAYTPSVAWSSSDISVATISQSGVAVGVSYGTTIITATLGNVSGSTSLSIANSPPYVQIEGNKSAYQNVATTVWASANDPYGSIASYAWTQIAGPTVTLSGANTSQISFTTPTVTADTVLTFQVTVADNLGATTSVSTNVTVKGDVSPDLVVTAASGSVTTVMSGKTFTFNSTTKNQGTAATTATITGLYLSTDATITTADTLVGSVSIGSLAAGASQSASTSITLSKKLARGTYYLGAIADYAGVQTESNESNNSFTGATIQVK